jgi:hypothetical protein
MRLSSTLVTCTVLLSAGCYSYVPASLPEVQPGSSVRIRISGSEADRLESIRFTDSRLLEGSIASMTEQQVYIDAIIRTVDAHGRTAQHTQRLNIAPQEIQAVQYRRLDGVKTAAAVGGVAFVLGSAAWIVLFGDLGRIDEFEPPGDFRLRLPLVRFTH